MRLQTVSLVERTQPFTSLIVAALWCSFANVTQVVREATDVLGRGGQHVGVSACPVTVPPLLEGGFAERTLHDACSRRFVCVCE